MTFEKSFEARRLAPVESHLRGVLRKIQLGREAGKLAELCDALDWLALLTTHVPNRGEQMVRYYGYHSNKSRGMRKKAGRDKEVSALIDSDFSRKAFRKNWARLI